MVYQQTQLFHQNVVDLIVFYAHKEAATEIFVRHLMVLRCLICVKIVAYVVMRFRLDHFNCLFSDVSHGKMRCAST